MTALCIEIATSNDLDAIIAVEQSAFPVTDRFPRTTWRRLLRSAQARGTSMTLVAREQGQVVGVINALLRCTSSTARIYSLAVDPALRGRGLGRLLVQALSQHLPPRIDSLSLEVRINNQAARHLYEKLGFTAERVLPSYYTDGTDGVRYRVQRGDLMHGR